MTLKKMSSYDMHNKTVAGINYKSTLYKGENDKHIYKFPNVTT